MVYAIIYVFIAASTFRLCNSIVVKALSYKQCIENETYPLNVVANFVHIEEDPFTYADINASVYELVERDCSCLADLSMSRDLTKPDVPLIKLFKNDLCAFLHQYVGEFWHDFTNALALPKGTCPIPKGRYNLRHHKLDFNRLTIIQFPKGFIKLKLLIQHKKSGKIMHCANAIAQVLSN